MTRAEERALKQLLRRATVPALLISVDRPRRNETAEEAMDRLWSDKAALAELLRRGWFDPPSMLTDRVSSGRMRFVK